MCRARFIKLDPPPPPRNGTCANDGIRGARPRELVLANTAPGFDPLRAAAAARPRDRFVFGAPSFTPSTQRPRRWHSGHRCNGRGDGVWRRSQPGGLTRNSDAGPLLPVDMAAYNATAPPAAPALVRRWLESAAKEGPGVVVVSLDGCRASRAGRPTRW